MSFQFLCLQKVVTQCRTLQLQSVTDHYGAHFPRRDVVAEKNSSLSSVPLVESLSSGNLRSDILNITCTDAGVLKYEVFKPRQ